MLKICSREKSEEKENQQIEGIVVLYDVIKESVKSVTYKIKSNMGEIGSFSNILIPYVCILCERNGILSNWFLLVVIPLILLYSCYIMKAVDMVFHNRTVDNIPLPYKRFTTEDNEGTITVEEGRIEELLLYVDELENELERLGKI